MTYSFKRWAITCAICLTLTACGGSEPNSSSAPSAANWSSTPARTQPMALGQAAPPTQFHATPLPSWNGEGHWWRAGATGQAVGWKLSDKPEHPGLRVAIVLDKGRMRELPPLEMDGQRLELDLSQDLHINLRGHVLAGFGAGTALWDGQAWHLRPAPTLALGETLVRERMVSLNNHDQYLLAIETTLADGSFSTRSMVVDGTKVRDFPGTPTALGDGGHVAVQDTRDGQMQASVYQLDGSYLMGGRITWGESNHLPKVMALLDDGTALGWVYIPGLGPDRPGEFRESSLFRAGSGQLNLWPRGMTWDSTHFIDSFFGSNVQAWGRFNRLGDLSTTMELQAYASGWGETKYASVLVMNDQVFDAQSLMAPGTDDPPGPVAAVGIALSDNRSLVQCLFPSTTQIKCWLVEPLTP